MRDGGNVSRHESAPLFEVPQTILDDLMVAIDTTHKWIRASLDGQRAYSHQASKIIDVMQLEFQQIREMNVDAVTRARAWLLPRD